MTPAEAMIVYLALQHQSTRTDAETRAFATAWGIIYQESEKIVARGYPAHRS